MHVIISHGLHIVYLIFRFLWFIFSFFKAFLDLMKIDLRFLFDEDEIRGQIHIYIYIMTGMLNISVTIKNTSY